MSYSRSPRALRSMTVGISGISSEPYLAAVLGLRRLRQPGEHAGPGEAPVRADPPPGDLPALRELRDELGRDVEQLGDAVERQHVGWDLAERVPAEPGLLRAHRAGDGAALDVAAEHLRDDRL